MAKSEKNNKKNKAQVGNGKKDKVSLKEYINGVRLEMKKVIWPTRSELGAYTVSVILVSSVFTLGFWLIDTGFLAVLRGILGITM